jgi:hypothetical protein
VNSVAKLTIQALAWFVNQTNSFNLPPPSPPPLFVAPCM